MREGERPRYSVASVVVSQRSLEKFLGAPIGDSLENYRSGYSFARPPAGGARQLSVLVLGARRPSIPGQSGQVCCREVGYLASIGSSYPNGGAGP